MDNHFRVRSQLRLHVPCFRPPPLWTPHSLYSGKRGHWLYTGKANNYVSYALLSVDLLSIWKELVKIFLLLSAFGGP